MEAKSAAPGSTPAQSRSSGKVAIVTVDLRTRTDSDRPLLDPAAFLDQTLPEAFDALTGPLPGRPGVSLRPLILEVDGERWGLAVEDGRATVTPSEPGPDEDGRHPAHVRLTVTQLHDLAHDYLTPIGLMTSGSLDLPVGQIGHLLDWWLVLRAALDGPHPDVFDDDQASDGVDPEPIDRSFTLDEDPGRQRAFLEHHGFIHLRGVFDAGEMAVIRVEIDAAQAHYQPGDGWSWWAETGAGPRLVRMQGFEHRSPATATLLDDERTARLGAIAGCDHRLQTLEGRRIEALVKPIGVTHGISDVPWHKDCSLGRHSYECCSITAGISIDGAGPTSGQLRVAPGSHRRRIWPSLLEPSAVGLADHPLPTDVGDVTLHLSCTLHMAQPPTERERRVLYTSFRLPQPDEEAAGAAHRRLRAVARETAPNTTSQVRASST